MSEQVKHAAFIGVVCGESERVWVEEFFQLFKTPWEFFRPHVRYSVVISTGEPPDDADCKLVIVFSSTPAEQRRPVLISEGQTVFAEYEGTAFPLYGKVAGFPSWGSPLARLRDSAMAVVVEAAMTRFVVIHAGYDLFAEVALLFSAGQPAGNALIPALDIHIAMLRDWILRAGIPIVEIPPVPAGRKFIACLTHDVDFVRITDHKLDHTLLGFVRRASAGSLWRLAKREISWREFLQNITALASLPAVYLGLRQDFWFEDFDRYLELERDTKATFFFIPFKNRPGQNVRRPHSRRRAAAYDVAEQRSLIEKLARFGNEIGVHGIDAWHSPERGTEERQRIVDISGNANPGVRMHWLCFDTSSPQVLEKAGFAYDSTVGYNDAAGCRAGTFQVFRPKGATTLLELPLHIQDSALFYQGRLGLKETQAWKICESVVSNAQTYGGVLTVLWHTRSMAPERLWGGFYIRLLETLKRKRVWFATAAQAVDWFRNRRAVSFQRLDSAGRIRVTLDRQADSEKLPAISIRIHSPNRTFKDIPCTGEPVMDVCVE